MTKTIHAPLIPEQKSRDIENQRRPSDRTQADEKIRILFVSADRVLGRETEQLAHQNADHPPDEKTDHYNHQDDEQTARRVRQTCGNTDDPNLLRKWQKVFVPHMRSALLEQLRRNPKSWTDLKLVEKEPAARR